MLIKEQLTYFTLHSQTEDWACICIHVTNMHAGIDDQQWLFSQTLRPPRNTFWRILIFKIINIRKKSIHLYSFAVMILSCQKSCKWLTVSEREKLYHECRLRDVRGLEAWMLFAQRCVNELAVHFYQYRLALSWWSAQLGPSFLWFTCSWHG